MQYLIITVEKELFFTKWFDVENNYQEGMIVVDFATLMVTRDGKKWETIETDHL